MGECVFGLTRDCQLVDKVGTEISGDGLAKFCEVCPVRLREIKLLG